MLDWSTFDPQPNDLGDPNASSTAPGSTCVELHKPVQTVEFLGIPGSGKTTLASAVHARLDGLERKAFSLRDAVSLAMHRGVGDRLIDPVMARLPKGMLSRYGESGFIRSNAFLVSLIDFMASHPLAVSAFLKGQARRSDFELSTDLVVRWFLQLVARYQLASSTLGEEDVLLLDEGFCQRVVTGFAHRFSEADHEDVTAYLAAAPRADLLVHLALSTDLAAERLARRGEPEVTKRLWGTDTDPAGFLADTAHCVEYVVEAAREAGWAVVELDGSGDLALVTGRVVDRIRSQTQATGSSPGDISSLDLPVDG
jgi:thymidylate kinase